MNIVGCYGPEWRPGVLVDHEYRAEATAVGDLTGDNARSALVDGNWYPVLCAEIVWIDTEDGRIDGRCGEPVLGDDAACPFHQPMIERWMNERNEEVRDGEEAFG